MMNFSSSVTPAALTLAAGAVRADSAPVGPLAKASGKPGRFFE
jgi:hypothetical protein